VPADLAPNQMAAVFSLFKGREDGRLEIVTSHESWREQDRAKNPIVRAELVKARDDVPVVAQNEKLLGSRIK